MTARAVNTRAVWPAFEPEVDQALFLLSYRNLWITGFGQMLLSALVGLATYRLAERSTLLFWLTWMWTTGAMYWLLLGYFRTPARATEPNPLWVKRWLRYRRSVQWLSALGWGGLSLLMLPNAAAHNVLIMAAFTGMVGYSAAGNSANDFFGVVLSAVTLVLVFVWRLPRVFASDAVPIMVMCVCYVTILTLVLRNTHNTLRRSIRLQLENQSLASDNAAQAARAEQANRDKSQFLAAASHDLRQPVHALLLLIEAYRQQQPEAMHHPLVQHMVQAGHSINTLFGALMELSRLESGAEKPLLTHFDLPVMLQLLCQREQACARAKGLTLRCFVAPSLRSVQLHTDPILLKRVLGNLLANAIRYSAQGGVLLSLRRTHGAALALEVWDSGIGIAPADVTRIFDPYVQLANPQRDRNQGLGLGLAIVQHISRLLGLNISVASRLGRGTVFRLTLAPTLWQRQADANSPATVAAPLQAQVLAVPWLAGRRLLLIDDDELVAKAMQALLSLWGLDLRLATQGDISVLTVCADNWVPDCVLCDYRLPGALDGIAVLERLQAHFPHMVGVLQTGELAPGVHQAAEEAGYLVLSKPVSAKILATTLATLLERRRSQRSL